MSQKIPSFFKIAKHQRFYFTPRYYDPIKEEIKKREDNIRIELKLRREGKSNSGSFSSQIHGSFKRYHSKTNKRSNLIRMIILALLISIVVFIAFA